MEQSKPQCIKDEKLFQDTKVQSQKIIDVASKLKYTIKFFTPHVKDLRYMHFLSYNTQKRLLKRNTKDCVACSKSLHGEVQRVA